MSYLEKFDYIFKINGRNRVSVYQTAMSRLSTEEKILEESIKVFPEDFWVYSENWNPKFSGIQPYLVEGLYIPETEYVCLSLLLQLSRISWDRLVNSSSARNLTSLLSFLPWIIKLMHEKKEHYKGIRLQDIFELLSNIYERKNEYMHVLMKDAANDSEFTHERIQLFLEMVCQHIADVYFPIYIDECLDHIALILRSPMSHYHSTALQMCLHFLKHSCATIVLSRMRELIHIVYEILNRKDGDSDIKLLAADVITCVINLANSSISGYPQTMNRARVAEVGVRKFVSLGSSRNLKHVISALQQISRSCAVANRETSDVL